MRFAQCVYERRPVKQAVHLSRAYETHFFLQDRERANVDPLSRGTPGGWHIVSERRGVKVLGYELSIRAHFVVDSSFVPAEDVSDRSRRTTTGLHPHPAAPADRNPPKQEVRERLRMLMGCGPAQIGNLRFRLVKIEWR